jgi:acyl-CoA reductase-like NAD-dependent aldehyde dehydrogenase
MPTRPQLSTSLCVIFDPLSLFTSKVGAAFGAAGQRCMALSTVVFVGEAQSWVNDLVALAQKLKVNAGERYRLIVGSHLLQGMRLALTLVR